MPKQHIESFVDPEEWLDEDRLCLLEGWARDGYTYAEVAQRIGVSVPQLTKMRKEYPEIAEALRKGREIVDYKVESALLKSALGYRTKETTIITVLRNGKMVETTRQTVTKDVQPSVQACQVWLYNRLPDKWKNMNARQNILSDLDDNANVSITITRAGNQSKDQEDDKEWQSQVNESVSIRNKTTEEKKQEAKEKRKKKVGDDQKKKTYSQDLDYWPEDWEDE